MVYFTFIHFTIYVIDFINLVLSKLQSSNKQDKHKSIIFSSLDSVSSNQEIFWILVNVGEKQIKGYD